jgi:hypothetical protein
MRSLRLGDAAVLGTVKIPNIGYRPLADFSARWELVLLSRKAANVIKVRRIFQDRRYNFSWCERHICLLILRVKVQLSTS